MLRDFAELLRGPALFEPAQCYGHHFKVRVHNNTVSIGSILNLRSPRGKITFSEGCHHLPFREGKFVVVGPYSILVFFDDEDEGGGA